MKLKEKQIIQQQIQEQYPGTDLEIDIDWDMGEIFFKAGIKEVVEWIEKNSSKGYIYEGQYTYDTNCDNQLFTDLGDWQAKLKEWGLRSY